LTKSLVDFTAHFESDLLSIRTIKATKHLNPGTLMVQTSAYDQVLALDRFNLRKGRAKGRNYSTLFVDSISFKYKYVSMVDDNARTMAEDEQYTFMRRGKLFILHTVANPNVAPTIDLTASSSGDDEEENNAVDAPAVDGGGDKDDSQSLKFPAAATSDAPSATTAVPPSAAPQQVTRSMMERDALAPGADDDHDEEEDDAVDGIEPSVAESVIEDDSSDDSVDYGLSQDFAYSTWRKSCRLVPMTSDECCR
jgi:hypothetical protein